MNACLVSDEEMKRIMEEGVDMDDPFENWYQGTVKNLVRKKAVTVLLNDTGFCLQRYAYDAVFLSNFYPTKAFMDVEEVDELEEE